MELINLTPHEVAIFRDALPTLTLPAAKAPVRALVRSLCEMIEGVPVTQALYETPPLPPWREGVYYIVSAFVAHAHPNRADLLIPDHCVKTDEGRIVGCRSLKCLATGAEI